MAPFWAYTELYIVLQTASTWNIGADIGGKANSTTASVARSGTDWELKGIQDHASGYTGHQYAEGEVFQL